MPPKPTAPDPEPEADAIEDSGAEGSGSGDDAYRAAFLDDVKRVSKEAFTELLAELDSESATTDEEPNGNGARSVAPERRAGRGTGTRAAQAPAAPVSNGRTFFELILGSRRSS